MVEYIYTKIIIVIALIVALTYGYLYYTNKEQVLNFQRKTNQFYYNIKIPIIGLFFMAIIAYVVYGIEKNVMKRKSLIKTYNLIIQMLATKIPVDDNDSAAKEKIKEIKNNIANQLAEKDKTGKRKKVCDNRGVCEIVKTNFIKDPTTIEEKINKELNYIALTTTLYPLRKVLEQGEGKYELAMEILIDELQALDPSVTVGEVCGGAGEVCNVAFGKQHPAIALAFMLRSKK